MLSFLKTKALRDKEAQIDKVGEELFRQISIFRDKCQNGKLTEEIFKARINHTYSAGYMLGFVYEKVSKLFDSKKMQKKYASKLYSGIFPQSGNSLVKSKCEARDMAEMLYFTKHDEKAQQFIDEFDTGVKDGRMELIEWEQTHTYVPHLLIDFLVTNKMLHKK